MQRAFIVILCVSLLLALPASAQETPNPDDYQLVPVAEGLERPLYLTYPDDGTGRLFVVQQNGLILVYQDGERLEAPFLDVSDRISPEAASGVGYSERGLLGLAFHPDYAENGRFFINYSDLRGMSIVAEYAVSDDPNIADPASERVLLEVEQPYSNHNGGQLLFGPDAYLYIALGDGGAGGDPMNNGQNPNTLLGTVLRIDVNVNVNVNVNVDTDSTDSMDSAMLYAIPEDNPFADGEEGAPEIWAWGLRNVWRMSFDRATGDLYMADVGQNVIEEINFQPADSTGGENYGWNAYEGTEPYSGQEAASEVVMPILQYDHSNGCSVTGGYVYRGEALPALDGVYVYGDWCNGNTWAAWRDAEGAWQSAPFMSTGMPISSFGEDADGELYLVDYHGVIYQLAAAE